MNIKNLALIMLCIIICRYTCKAQSNENLCNPSSGFSVFLRSNEGYNGASHWKIKKFSDTKEDGSIVSKINYDTKDWYPAIVPGTVLNSLVYNKVYPEPYYGDNNRKNKNLIPDIADAGREFYHYWFRTEFEIPKDFAGKHVWLKFHGINYRCEIWVNGKYFGKMAGMFNTQSFDITSVADFNKKNVVAVSVLPIDFPGTTKLKDTRPGAVGENHNGGDGEI
ncbi:MAG: beta galactosidase jelly roll domain-containing protein, partial [Ignavibacteriaceae bacterium]|nr:beta galactosidase jelly roll domain-containing protein [Ignavibacteriaceae bacterium]